MLTAFQNESVERKERKKKTGNKDLKKEEIEKKKKNKMENQTLKAKWLKTWKKFETKMIKENEKQNKRKMKGNNKERKDWKRGISLR